MTPTERIAAPSVPADSQTPTDPSTINLAGYELQSLLGSGGYGEVWKAVGPGGFPKAVKILYGHRDGEHAESELKALNRMRDLRHPFLLNIERVEVCNNRLVVVTELADCNLNERFEACTAEGRMGIPRDELLGYLRDAADALDFMYNEHGLQHLDIKPDNLLLQGNYVKLADFSLAKDVSMANVSLINGFTPLYASPELFEGRPGQHSDQYSLAIVYQMMLTGQAPFNGRNAAQLTSQHLRSQPDLLPLALADRPVIARALSKTASARYSCCREMIDELLNRNRGGHAGGSTEVGPPRESKPVGASVDAAQATQSRETEFEASKPASVNSDPETAHTLKPALFIGVGGVGGNILRQLKNAWASAAGMEVPSWQLLAIDSDLHSLRMTSELPSEAQLGEVETMPIQLRSSKEYRQSRNLDMSWLSRRWLFNIPRSCQVEGMRPLARLAVQDHLAELTTRLRSRIEAAADSDLAGQSAAAMSTPFASGELDVYIVGAVSGGTASGAITDIALIVQQLLSEMDGLKASVSGLLLHMTGTSETVEGIQSANTIACLKELRLLGMNGMGIRKGFTRESADLVPFEHTWFLHCGESLTDAQFDSVATSAADFLFNVTATPAATAWRHWRNQADPLAGEDGEPSFRLLGMSAVDSDVYAMAESESVSLAAAVMQQRLSAAPGSEGLTQEDRQRVQELLNKLHLTESSLPQRILEELRGTSGRQIEKLAERVFEQVVDTESDQSLQERLAARLQTSESGSGGASLQDLRQHASRSLNQDRQHCERLIRNLVLELMENAGTDCHMTVISALRDALESAQRCCHQLAQETDHDFRKLCRELVQDTDNREQLQEICRQYCVLSGSMAIYQVFLEHLQNCNLLVDSIGTEAAAAQQRMQQVLAHLRSDGNVHDGLPAPVVEAFRMRLGDERALKIESYADSNADLPALATRLIDRATGFLLSTDGSCGPSNASFPASAWPSLKGLGGRHRVMAWLPDGTDEQPWMTRLTQEFDDAVAVCRHRRRQVKVACEVEGICSTRLLKHLQNVEPSSWEMANRIHTRTDVQW